MTRYPLRRLVAAAAALSLGLSGPRPVYALRAGLEGTTRSEVAQRLGAPAATSQRATAGMEEGVRETLHVGIVARYNQQPGASIQGAVLQWSHATKVGMTMSGGWSTGGRHWRSGHGRPSDVVVLGVTGADDLALVLEGTAQFKAPQTLVGVVAFAPAEEHERIQQLLVEANISDSLLRPPSVRSPRLDQDLTFFAGDRLSSQI